MRKGRVSDLLRWVNLHYFFCIVPVLENGGHMRSDVVEQVFKQEWMLHNGQWMMSNADSVWGAEADGRPPIKPSRLTALLVLSLHSSIH